MRGRTSSIKVTLSDEQRKTLDGLLRRQKTPVGLAKRARAIVLLSQGQPFSHTAHQVGLGERHLRKWARRFMEEGMDGLKDRARGGRPPVFSPSTGVVFGQAGV